MAIDKKHIIGIDIGGSKIDAILFGNGKILKSAKIPTPKNKKEFLKCLDTIIGKIISGINKKKLIGIGCGIAGTLDLKNGAVLNAPNLRFLNNFNIKNWLEKKFNCKVKIDNDARCFTRGEYLFGAGRGHKNLISITLGTGIGGGIIIDKKIFYGASDSAGELGHTIIDNGKDWEFLLLRRRKNIKKLLGIGFANIINILDPEIIVIGGGASDLVESLIAEVIKIMNRFIISPKSRKNVNIITGKLGDNAGAIGAAALFYE